MYKHFTSKLPQDLLIPNIEVLWKNYQQLMQIVLSDYNNNIYSSYIYGFKKLKLDKIRLIDLEDLSKILKKYGWTLVWVNGYISANSYATLIANNFFPVSKKCRSFNQIGYSPVPDFIHDIFGHIPMLLDSEYVKYLKQITKLMSLIEATKLDKEHYKAELELALLCNKEENKNSKKFLKIKNDLKNKNDQLRFNPSLQSMLSRIFLWSIEFGIIGTKKNFKVFGAGIISSIEEFRNITNDKVEFRDYNMEVIYSNFDYFTSTQKFLYTAPDMRYYNKILQQFTLQNLQSRYN